MVDIAAEAAQSGAWQGCGIRSLKHWLTWQLDADRGRSFDAALDAARDRGRVNMFLDPTANIVATWSDGVAVPDFAAWWNIAITARCRVPWCTNGRWLDVHHITHWIDGGATDSDTGRAPPEVA